MGKFYLILHCLTIRKSVIRKKESSIFQIFASVAKIQSKRRKKLGKFDVEITNLEKWGKFQSVIMESRKIWKILAFHF